CRRRGARRSTPAGSARSPGPATGPARRQAGALDNILGMEDRGGTADRTVRTTFEGGTLMNRTWIWTGILTALVVLAFIGVAPGQGKMDQLVAAAKQEGQLTVIALPHDWCGYGALIEAFKGKYGLKVNELN